MHFLCHVAKPFDIKGLRGRARPSPVLVRHVWTLHRTCLVHIAMQRTTKVRASGLSRRSIAGGPADPTTLWSIVTFQQENAMTRTAWFDEVQKNISDLIKRSPAADVERNVKAVLGTAFTKLDLVTR